MNDDRPFGYDALKIRAVFIPEGNPENISAADITNHLGHDVLRIRAIFIPDGNPDNITPADITSYLGHDVVRVRYAWRSSGQEGLELEPMQDDAEGASPTAGAMQNTDGPSFASSEPQATRPMPPTPTLAQAPSYVDPAKTAVATWHAINALSPPSQPAASRRTDSQGEAVTRPGTSSADVAGSSKIDAFVQNGPLSNVDRLGLYANSLGGKAETRNQLIPSSATPSSAVPTQIASDATGSAAPTPPVQAAELQQAEENIHDNQPNSILITPQFATAVGLPPPRSGDPEVQLAASYFDMFGMPSFIPHAMERMNQDGISPTQLNRALSASPVPGTSPGTMNFVGGGVTAVVNEEGWIVTVY